MSLTTVHVSLLHEQHPGFSGELSPMGFSAQDWVLIGLSPSVHVAIVFSKDGCSYRCSSITLPLFHHEAESMYPPLESGWVFLTVSHNSTGWGDGMLFPRLGPKNAKHLHLVLLGHCQARSLTVVRLPCCGGNTNWPNWRDHVEKL